MSMWSTRRPSAVVLKTPSAPFLSQLTDRAGMIVSPKAAAAEGKDFAQHPVCAGPMKFVERVAQDHVTLERFADYWNKDAIHIDRVIYQSHPRQLDPPRQPAGRQHRPRGIHRAHRHRRGEAQSEAEARDL